MACSSSSAVVRGLETIFLRVLTVFLLEAEDTGLGAAVACAEFLEKRLICWLFCIFWAAFNLVLFILCTECLATTDGVLACLCSMAPFDFMALLLGIGFLTACLISVLEFCLLWTTACLATVCDLVIFSTLKSASGFDPPINWPVIESYWRPSIVMIFFLLTFITFMFNYLLLILNLIADKSKYIHTIFSN